MTTPYITSETLDLQQTQEPLQPEEIKLLNRLLSDPSVFPRAFKQWVTDHSSDTVDITKSQVHGLINSSGSIILNAQSWEQLGAAFCPMIVPYPAATPPNGWLNCDGTMLSQTKFKVLYGFLGHQHDIIVSTGQFGLPDLRGRTIYGFDPNGASGGIPFGFATHDSGATGGRGPYHSHVTKVTTPVNVGVQLASGSTYVRYSNQDLDYTSYGLGGVTYPQRDAGGFYALNYIIAAGMPPGSNLSPS